MEYISQATLDVNGMSIEDFKSVTEKEIEYYKEVKLMGKTGFMKATPTYGVTVEYVIPSTGFFDWSEVVNGRLTVRYENGETVTYTGVYVLKVGEKKVDGDNETTQSIDLGATGRKSE